MNTMNEYVWIIEYHEYPSMVHKSFSHWYDSEADAVEECSRDDDCPVSWCTPIRVTIEDAEMGREQELFELGILPGSEYNEEIPF